MREACCLALDSIAEILRARGQVLDCGASAGGSYDRLKGMIAFQMARHVDIEWSQSLIQQSMSKGFNLIQGDLSCAPPFEGEQFRRVIGLSVAEYLLNDCAFMFECQRIPEDRGTLGRLRRTSARASPWHFACG